MPAGNRRLLHIDHAQALTSMRELNFTELYGMRANWHLPTLYLHLCLWTGKSSMLNAICGEERAIVCDLSGTTRDAVDTTITLPDGQKLTLIDTAGIRKRARVADSR